MGFVCVGKNIPLGYHYTTGEGPHRTTTSDQWPASWTFTFAKLQTSEGLLGAGMKNDGIDIKSDLSILPIGW